MIILDQTDSYTAPASLSTDYTRTLHKLDWWFPEDYKTWSWTDFLSKTVSPSSWHAIWNWETVRTPFGPRAADSYYLYIRKGYFAPF